jgi:hypothetical protein
MLAVTPDRSARVVVPEGDYRVTVERLPFGITVDSARYDSTNLSGSWVTLDADSPRELTIRFAATQGAWGVIRGRVTGIENLPSSAERAVILQGDTLLQRLEAVIGPDGSFEFPKAFSGAYTLAVDTGVFGVLSVPVNSGASDVELRVPAPVRMRGKVTTDNNATPPGFGFALVHNAQEIRVPVAVEPDGQFSAILPEGESRIAIVGMNTDLYPTRFTHGSANLFEAGLDLNGTNAATPIEIALGRVSATKHFKVSGRLVQARNSVGMRLGLASVVVLSGVMPDRQLTVTAAADGSFEFPAVLPGPYTITVQPPAMLRSLLPASMPVSIAVLDKDVDNVDVVIGGATLSGQVSVISGSQIPRFFFQLTGAGAAQPSNPQLGQAPNDIRPDVLFDGAFSVTLPMGRHFLTVEGFPETYTVREFTCGDIDLLKSPLTVGSGSSCQLRIVFASRRNTRIARANDLIGQEPNWSPTP